MFYSRIFCNALYAGCLIRKFPKAFTAVLSIVCEGFRDGTERLSGGSEGCRRKGTRVAVGKETLLKAIPCHAYEKVLP